MVIPVFAGVETGGTKIVARVVHSDGAVLADGRWPTMTPRAAEEELVAFIQRVVPAHAQLARIGIASFGPLIVDRDSRDYGCMLDTPKPGWTRSNLRAALSTRLRTPVLVDTDVNAAALAELRHGAGRGLASLAYVTVGTGIGGGLAIDGRPLMAAGHPEIGHIRLTRLANDRALSTCPFHDDCVEGLASGPAIARRLVAHRNLAESPDILALVARYLGQLAATLALGWAPHRIAWGGGVMTTAGLLDGIRDALRESLCGYGASPAAAEPDFLVPAALADSGLEGALLMAREGRDVVHAQPTS
jgi:fructokinase